MTCPHIQSSDEGTGFCALANVTGKEYEAMKAKLDMAVKALEFYAYDQLRPGDDAYAREALADIRKP